MRVSIKGSPVAVLASGPSLCEEDVSKVRIAGLLIIAVNSSWMMAPDCDVLVAGDYRWWKAYGEHAPQCLRISRSDRAEKHYNAKRMKSRVRHGYNSGMVAVEWAIRKGASKVIMLGFDCSLKNGAHWHGGHTDTPDPNELRVKRWKEQFAELRRAYPKADVVNCSRYTEIDAFPVRQLEHVLCGLG
jgi:hypothetical protein